MIISATDATLALLMGMMPYLRACNTSARHHRRAAQQAAHVAALLDAQTKLRSCQLVKHGEPEVWGKETSLRSTQWHLHVIGA